MATKHFFSDTSGVVVLGLESLVSRNSHLALDAPNKVVYSKTHPTNKVSVISGGGSGHEPAWSGYVGEGMLAAAVNGEVFASPSTKQVMAAIEHVPSDAGIILCITNYTGDNLHFGLAKEKAVGLGYKIGMLRMTDDVGLGRKQTTNLGRRGLAGNMFVLKLCGAASQDGWDFERCMKLGQSVNDHCVTIGSSLDYCHIPGRAQHESLPPNTYSVAQGIHNEAGLKEVTPIPAAADMIPELLTYLLNPDDPDRSFTPFNFNDEVALLINNFGGVSNFELEALTSTTLRLLEKDWNISPKRTLVSCFETSLNAPGWSISLLNVSGISNEISIPTSKLWSLLDSQTTAPAWPRNGYREINPVDRSAHRKGTAVAASDTTSTTSTGPKVDPVLLEQILHTACERTIAAEPEITHWDQQMGDGDCGEAVSALCNAILTAISSPTSLCQKHSGALLPILDALGESIEDVGGSLSAILAIWLASFTSALKRDAGDAGAAHEATLASAAEKALEALKGYTAAREGGRTVMDALIPFCETFAKSGGRDFAGAVKAAEVGARKTEGMKGTFGRAAYVGDELAEGGKRDVPMDPGAWALVVFLKGMVEGYGGLAKIDSHTRA